MSARPIRRTYLLEGRALEARLFRVRETLQGEVSCAGESLPVDVALRRLGPHDVEFGQAGQRVRATVVREGEEAWVSIEGRSWHVTLQEAGAGPAHPGGEEDFALSPMTGLLATVSVEVGDQVERGAELFVVEAMKMEYVVRASRDLKVAEIRHVAGGQVDQGAVVVAFEESA